MKSFNYHAKRRSIKKNLDLFITPWLKEWCKKNSVKSFLML